MFPPRRTCSHEFVPAPCFARSGQARDATKAILTERTRHCQGTEKIRCKREEIVFRHFVFFQPGVYRPTSSVIAASVLLSVLVFWFCSRWHLLTLGTRADDIYPSCIVSCCSRSLTQLLHFHGFYNDACRNINISQGNSYLGFVATPPLPPPVGWVGWGGGGGEGALTTNAFIFIGFNCC